jgi:probable addiction module antidote protein
MKEDFREFDVLNYFKTDQDLSDYLNTVVSEGDTGAIMVALSDVARAKNMSALAREIGVTREGLYKALRPGSNPSFNTVLRLAHALGLQLQFGLDRSGKDGAGAGSTGARPRATPGRSAKPRLKPDPGAPPAAGTQKRSTRTKAAAE